MAYVPEELSSDITKAVSVANIGASISKSVAGKIASGVSKWVGGIFGRKAPSQATLQEKYDYGYAVALDGGPSTAHSPRKKGDKGRHANFLQGWNAGNADRTAIQAAITKAISERRSVDEIADAAGQAATGTSAGQLSNLVAHVEKWILAHEPEIVAYLTEQATVAAELEARAEAERMAAEQARLEAERVAAERAQAEQTAAAKAEADRIAAEHAAEQARLTPPPAPVVPAPIEQPAHPSVALPAQPTAVEPDYSAQYGLMTEEQLRAELARVEEAIGWRQAQGLSLDDRYTDMTLLDLARRRVALVAALAPYALKKYWMYGAGALGVLGLFLLGRSRR